MGYKALNWAWDSDLPSTQKFVLVALADMADEKNSCYPGQDRLAAMTGTSVSTVRRALKELESMGALTRKPRGIAGGGRTSDRYVLNTTRSICAVRANRSSDGGKPVIHDTETGHSDRGTPREPSVEPPVLLSTDKSSDLGDHLPADWRPGVKHSDLAESLNLDVQLEFQKFSHHAQVNRRRLKNWNAGFTNWLKQSAVFAQKRHGVRQQPQSFARQAQSNSLALFEHYKNQEVGHAEIGSREVVDVQALN